MNNIEGWQIELQQMDRVFSPETMNQVRRELNIIESASPMRTFIPVSCDCGAVALLDRADPKGWTRRLLTGDYVCPECNGKELGCGQ